MRVLNGIKAITTAIANVIRPKVRARQSVTISTTEAERLDRLRNPTKYLGK
jgi:hypothetical protein